MLTISMETMKMSREKKRYQVQTDHLLMTRLCIELPKVVSTLLKKQQWLDNILDA